MDVGEKIAAVPALPGWVRELGQAAAVCSLIVGGGLLIGKLIDDISS
jgi:hypothetical protein